MLKLLYKSEKSLHWRIQTQ